MSRAACGKKVVCDSQVVYMAGWLQSQLQPGRRRQVLSAELSALAGYAAALSTLTAVELLGGEPVVPAVSLRQLIAADEAFLAAAEAIRSGPSEREWRHLEAELSRCLAAHRHVADAASAGWENE